MNNVIDPLLPAVYVIDDDEAVLNAMEGLFLSVKMQVRTFSSATDFFAANLPVKHCCGCIVTDMRMPGMSGLDLLQKVKKQALNLPVIFVSGHANVEDSVRAMKEGAFDFFQKPFNEQKLLHRVGKATSMCIKQCKFEKDREKLLGCYHDLSERECEVLEQLVGGAPNKAIARNLDISAKTVEFHRANIMKKFDANSLADLILKAVAADPSLSPLVEK